MPSQAVTRKGQITLRRELLQHMGVEPGQRVEFEKLPGGELRMKAAQPKGSIEAIFGMFAGRVKEPLSIEEMNQIIADGWAGKFADDEHND